ncbi:MAG TPA: SWIM zinc finger family protein [Anaerolineaceae bacterium]|nr:SWIM zinc finger family protein [Anaerolineaceae bacterium]
MDYSLIGKIEKAKRYAQERERFEFHSFTVTVKGDNNSHEVIYAEGEWKCDCEYFQSRGRCVHTMALETILEGMMEPVHDSLQN